MRIFIKKCLVTRLALTALLGLAMTGFMMQVQTAQASSDATLDAQSLLRDVLERVREFYIAPVDAGNLVQTGLQSMLAMLDAESGYLPPGTPPLKNTDSVGYIPELGLIVTYADGMLVVVSPTDYGPAKEAGIRPKDRLYALGRTPLMVTSLYDGAAQMRRALSDLAALKSETENQFLMVLNSKPNNGGKLMSFIVQHADQTVETIVISPNFEAGQNGKELGPAVSVSWQTAPDTQDANGKDKIAMIRLSRLPSDAATEIENKFANLVQNKTNQKPSGVILDLRRLAGGDFNAALASANLFLDKGVLAKIKQHDPAQTSESKNGTSNNKDKNATNLVTQIINADAKRQSKFLRLRCRWWC
ncbi:MAG: S41 family peptidase [Alphaproteobacteria bacterium]|nr:S41 family peptidase [Alphaproteobacteria bacterium]